MRTFEDLGFTFDFDEECATCQNGSCHNIAVCKKDGKEYSVHISTNKEKEFFDIYGYTNSSTDSDDDFYESFTDENEAVNYVCSTFDNFKCF